MTESFDKLAGRIEGAEDGYNRNMKCRLYKVDEGLLALTRFVDKFHNFTMAMILRKSDLTIGEASVKMDKVPYEICRETMNGIGNLRGLLAFHPAVVREVRRRIKRKEGCTHLFEMIEFTLQSLFSGSQPAGLADGPAVDSIRELPPEEHRKLHATIQRFKNTCRAFASED